MAWGARSSLKCGSALLAAPRTHYLADSGECVSLQPSVASSPWLRGPDPEPQEMLGLGGKKQREEGALERLGHGRAEPGQSWWLRQERMSQRN